MSFNLLPIAHEGTEASCGEVAFYLRGVPMGRPVDAQDAYAVENDVPVQMHPDGEVVMCLSCGKRVSLADVERRLREVPVDPLTGKSDDEMVTVGMNPATGDAVTSSDLQAAMDEAGEGDDDAHGC